MVSTSATATRWRPGHRVSRATAASRMLPPEEHSAQMAYPRAQRSGLPQAGFLSLDAVVVVEQAGLAGAGRAVAGIERLWLVLVLDQHGCLRGRWSGRRSGQGCGWPDAAGRPGGAAR